TGIVAVEPRGRVRVRAGTRLRDLSVELAAHGLGLENLGDIDVQTVAGAVSTGTHGTGARFGGLATQVVGLELVRGDGTVVRAGEGAGPPVAGAVVGLGALGVVTEVTLQCVPAFTLHAVEDTEPLAAALASLDERVATHDHYELYWFPYADRCLTKTNTRRTGPPASPRAGRDARAATHAHYELNWFRSPDRCLTKPNTRRTGPPEHPLPRWRRMLEDEVLTNGAYRVVNEVGRLRPGWVPGLNR